MYEANTLFDNRYLLLSCEGKRQQVEYWLASDTSDQDKEVIIKIYCTVEGNPSRNADDFSHDSAVMHNFGIATLLAPVARGVWHNVPYLVYNFLPNGSINSLFGRATESEVVHFIHDMASALTVLHGSGRAHGEIRPDNIAIDNNGTFTLGGYGMGGIPGLQPDSDNSPYSAPETFSDTNTDTAPADIWAVAAIAYQMLSGEPPYGSFGGYMLDPTEPIAPIECNIDPRLRSLLTHMIDSDPSKRPSAMAVEHETENMLRKSPHSLLHKRRGLKLAVIAVVAAGLLAGLIAYDHNRVKTYFYTDYVNYYGCPKGVGILNGSEMRKRHHSYRIEMRGGKVISMTRVNSHNNPVPDTESLNTKERFDRVTLAYGPDGKVDYKTVYDYTGRPRFIIDYSADFTMAILRAPDNNAFESVLGATDNVHHHNYEWGIPPKDKTSRYRLEYNDEGLLMERQYMGKENVPLARNGNVYGHRWLYDDHDRIIEQQSLGFDRQLIEDLNGVAITRYEYNRHGQIEQVAYFDSDNRPAFNSAGCTEVRFEYDRNGNLALENYFTDNGQTAQRTDRNVAGYVYTYDDRGNMVRRSSFDIEGKNSFSLRGYVAQLNEYDDNGFLVRTRFVDNNDQPVLATMPDGNASIIEYTRDRKGRETMRTTLDEAGHPLENTCGVASVKSEYNKDGLLAHEKYYSKDGLPTYYRGLYHSRNYRYDKTGRLVGIDLTDIDGSPATNNNRVHEFSADYSERGVVTRIDLFDTEGKPISVPAGYASIEYGYSRTGNITDIAYLDERCEPVDISGGYSRMKLEYCVGANVVAKSCKFHADGSPVSTEINEYDSLWRVCRHYLLGSDGKTLAPGTTVVNIAYNSANRPSRRSYTDLKGNPVDSTGTNYSTVTFSYDHQGNRRSESFFGCDGHPVSDHEGVHTRRFDFDQRNRVTRITLLGVDNKPLPDPKRAVDTRYKYNKWNNCCETVYFNASGEPVTGPDGYHRSEKTYTPRGLIRSVACYGTDGCLTPGLDNGYARVEYHYDQHGNTVMRIYSNTDSVVRRDRLFYNNQHRQTELRTENSRGKLDDSFSGYSRILLYYDSSGTTPERCEFYDSTGKLLSNRVWVRRLGTWSRAIPSTNTRFSRAPGSDWYSELLNYAATCPLRINSIVELTSMAVTSSKVTMFLRVSNFSSTGKSNDTTSMREYCSDIVDDFRHDTAIPSNVKVVANVIDHNNKTLFSI